MSELQAPALYRFITEDFDGHRVKFVDLNLEDYAALYHSALFEAANCASDIRAVVVVPIDAQGVRCGNEIVYSVSQDSA